MHLRPCKISRGSCSEPDLPARGAAPTPHLTRVRGRPRPSAKADRPHSRRPLRAAHPAVAPPGGSHPAVAVFTWGARRSSTSLFLSITSDRQLLLLIRRSCCRQAMDVLITNCYCTALVSCSSLRIFLLHVHI